MKGEEGGKDERSTGETAEEEHSQAHSKRRTVQGGRERDRVVSAAKLTLAATVFIFSSARKDP
jgi:hypothetical protein